MSTIYLLRHGAMAGESRNRIVGQIDTPLASEGIRQARVLAEALLPQPIGAVHCSDLRRSWQTAEIIAETLDVPMEVHRELREVSLGEWDGQPRHEVAACWAEQLAAHDRDVWHYCPPGGESLADCLVRAMPVWESITIGDEKAVAVVGHAGLNRLLLCRLLCLPVSKLSRLDQDYGCINIIERDVDGARVKLINGSPTDLAARPPKRTSQAAVISLPSFQSMSGGRRDY